MTFQVENLQGSGVDLQDILTAMNDTLAITTAEVRYDARHKPVRIRYNYKEHTFIVTEITLDKDGLVLTIDPIFGESDYDGPFKESSI